jgi:hypothetical protein
MPSPLLPFLSFVQRTSPLHQRPAGTLKIIRAKWKRKVDWTKVSVLILRLAGWDFLKPRRKRSQIDQIDAVVST